MRRGEEEEEGETKDEEDEDEEATRDCRKCEEGETPASSTKNIGTEGLMGEAESFVGIRLSEGVRVTSKVIMEFGSMRTSPDSRADKIS